MRILELEAFYCPEIMSGKEKSSITRCIPSTLDSCLCILVNMLNHSLFGPQEVFSAFHSAPNTWPNRLCECTQLQEEEISRTLISITDTLNLFTLDDLLSERAARAEDIGKSKMEEQNWLFFPLTCLLYLPSLPLPTSNLLLFYAPMSHNHTDTLSHIHKCIF